MVMAGGGVGVSAAPYAKSLITHMYTYVAGTARNLSISINPSVHPPSSTLTHMYTRPQVICSPPAEQRIAFKSLKGYWDYQLELDK